MHRALILLLLTGCLDAPDDGDILVTVMPRQDAPVADGIGRADLEIVLDEASRAFGRDVSVRVDGAHLGVEGPIKAPPDGVLVLPLRYDRRPGPVEVEVRAGTRLGTDDSLLLAARPPDRFAVRPPARVLKGIGDTETVTMELLVDTPGGRPSVGARVYFAACCAGPAECANPLLRVPAVAVMDETTDTVSVQVTVRPQEPVDEPQRVEGLFTFGLDGRPDCDGAVQLARVPIDLPLAQPDDPFAVP